MELTPLQIKEINEQCPADQGVFLQPSGIPTPIKDLVIYKRWCTGGERGGGYHEDDHRHSFTGDDEPSFIALDKVLKVLKPQIGYLEYKEIENTLIHSADDGGWDAADYYGNYDNYEIRYIILPELIKFLGV